MKIKQVHEYNIDEKLEADIQNVLNRCFPEIYPTNRIYFKQLPHLRFLAFNQENQLVGHVGLDYRVMNLNGEIIKVLGLIDLCVSINNRSEGIGSLLLSEIDRLSKKGSVDFILLFADNTNLYTKNGYQTVENNCTWLKINHGSQNTIDIGSESINGLMIKKVGNKEWVQGNLDLLGYLY
ncbi:GNAT family N-acetyltransferase [Paenibacillus sp. RRE4]|uniref:GNAT family N-acetyltransferase n=1 Tax=Paenibacillus sp. RRE4 TaxID=2962587 RepID=UPI0028827BAE|nr:GNAT family N-acetyltransferase [Paenibacillus sp. RRE4]MDT0123059.1 GNAT family N-acetyltransferase [Paenibacillus sp. RRE4]